jgi:hypothetical protein
MTKKDESTLKALEQSIKFIAFAFNEGLDGAEQAGRDCESAINMIKTTETPTLVGWVILDCNGTIFHMIPKSKSFFGQIIENEPPSQELVKHLERDWEGLTPFTVKEIFT